MNQSVLIATPMYGGMCSGLYVSGLIQTIINLNNHGVTVQWMHLGNESLITRARDEVARTFLSLPHTHLMFIDSDIVFPAGGVKELLDADEDIVCGIYPKKEVDWAAVERAAKAGKTDLKDYAGSFVVNMLEGTEQVNEKGLVEIRHGGTGFMLVKKEVFETLTPHVPKYRKSTVVEGYPDTYQFFDTSIDNTGALLSEDYHFCALARAHGHKAFAHPFVQLAHVGTYTFEGDVMKAGGNLK